VDEAAISKHGHAWPPAPSAVECIERFSRKTAPWGPGNPEKGLEKQINAS
jgi:hypothetical protein